MSLNRTQRFPEFDASREPGDMFADPVLVPAPDIDATPLVCLAMNEEYAAIAAKALERLLYYDAWSGSDTDVQRATIQTDHLIGQLLDGVCLAGAEQPEDTECIQVNPYHPAIEYWPNHPILSPNYRPENFSAPVWITGSGLPFLGPDDAIINPLSVFDPIILTEIWSVGLPSIRLHFNGPGKVNLTFLDAVQGGLVYMFPDGNFLLGDLINVNHIDITDITDFPTWIADVIEGLQGEPINEVFHQFDFETAGDHTLTMWFIPLGEEPPYIGFGGGLRHIELCGEITLIEETVMPYNLVLNGCDLELQLDGQTVNTVRVMTPEPNCDFGNTVTVSNGDGDYLTALRMDNTAVGGSAHAIDLQFTGLDSVDQVWNMAWIEALGYNLINRTSRLDLWTTEAGTTRPQMYIGGGRGLQIPMGFGMGHADGMLLQTTGDYDTFRMIRGRVGSREVFNQFARGDIQLRRSQTNSVKADAAISIFNKADGAAPAALFGGQIQFFADTPTTQDMRLGGIYFRWANPNEATRSPEYRLNLSDYTGSYDALRLAAQAGATRIGVHGKDPIAKPTIIGLDTDQAMSNLLAALDNYGWIDNQAIVGSAAHSHDPLGDRNLPPETVLNACNAANFLAERIQDHITITAGISPFTDIVIYTDFADNHGYVLKDLWTYASEASAAGSTIVTAIAAELALNLGAFVQAIYDNMYDRTGLINWVANFGFTGPTSSLLQRIIPIYTEPTWKEFLFTGSVSYSEIHPCVDCVGGGPTGGNEWAIEWSPTFGLSEDWYVHLCGSEDAGGFNLELGCESTIAKARMRFDIVSAGTVEWDTVSITVAYSCEDPHFLRGTVRGNNDAQSNIVPPEVIDGVGTETITLTGSDLFSTNGQFFTIEPYITELPQQGSATYKVVAIRCEGNNSMPDHNGRQC